MFKKVAIDKQNHKHDLFERIQKAFTEAGYGNDSMTRNYLLMFDEVNAAFSHELASEIFLNGLKVLDVGCGLGGLCRMLAENYNCSATGIDLSADHIHAAVKLSEFMGISDRTQFFRADALDLPFEDNSFDIVWTQHTQMNIMDKEKFYSEINRVLIKEGAFVFFDVFARNLEKMNYPLPWAENQHFNFLISFSRMENLLREMGFEKLKSSNQTGSTRLALQNVLSKSKRNKLTKNALQIRFGNTFKKKIKNLLKVIESGAVELQSGIYRKTTINN